MPDTPEMVERVARAIRDLHDNGSSTPVPIVTVARATIAAMRSPIVRQLRAAGCTAPLAELTESAEFKNWQAMIDEALGASDEVSRM